MATTTKTETEKKIKPKVDLMPKYELQEACFKSAKIRDIKTGKESSWPYIPNDVSQRAYEEHFLDKVVDPETGTYFPKRDEEGKPVKTTPDNVPKYVVVTIMRFKKRNGTEFLLSKGNFIAYDALGDEVKHYISKPEVWRKVHFVYEREWDNKRKMLVKNCKGPGEGEEVYTLPFNETNLKLLFDKRQDDNIGWILINEAGDHPRSLSHEPNINDTFKLFLKPFDYLYKAEYISAAMKAQYRQEAIDAGLLAAPTTSGVQ